MRQPYWSATTLPLPLVIANSCRAALALKIEPVRAKTRPHTAAAPVLPQIQLRVTVQIVFVEVST